MEVCCEKWEGVVEGVRDGLGQWLVDFGEGGLGLEKYGKMGQNGVV